MAKEDSRSLGITIRGGSEHGLGVYVSQVQRNSTAHSHGLQVCTLVCLAYTLCAKATDFAGVDPVLVIIMRACTRIL